jgi:hypothetical protein
MRHALDGLDKYIIINIMYIMNKKHRHHYVWQNYLKPWSIKNKIFCLQNDNIYHSNLINIGIINDFYKFNLLTRNDIIFLNEFVKRVIPELKEIDNFIIKMFSEINVNELDDKKIDETIEILKHNFEEDIFMEIEGNSSKYLEFLLNKDISFYKDEKYNFEFNLYISSQYFRTRKFYETVKSFFNRPEQCNVDNIINIFRQLFIINYAYKLTVDNNNCELILLENNTKRKLITGDQPIFNLFGDGLIPPKETALYYPISPDISIILNRGSSIKIDKYLTEIDITDFNIKMLNNSYFQLFSINEDELKFIKYGHGA